MANTSLAQTVARTTQSSRYLHSRQLEESYLDVNQDHITSLNGLIQTLQDNAVPGPQLFRLHHEFTEKLGIGGESEVRGISSRTLEKLRQADKQDRLNWPVEKIAIKRHKPKYAGSTHLSSRFLAARREVLALAPTLFQKHPNIVQLLGWGFCLDIIENASPESYQIPLLILERAEMDLYRFLQEVVLVTETTAVRMRRRRNVPPRREMRANRDEETGLDKWRLQQDDVVRRLCIDVGNGLYALHQEKLAHGDLKPQNVLVFKTGTEWVAKLCDFGCTRGIVSPNEDNSGNTMYAGTLGWLPPEANTGTQDGIEYDSLQKCDIYTYGLLVWSVFCHSGNPTLVLEDEGDRQKQIQPDIILEGAIQDVQESFSRSSRWLQNTIISFLKDTLQPESASRPSTPWDRLRTRSESVALQIKNIRESWSRGRLTLKRPYKTTVKAPKTVNTESPMLLASHPPLTPEDKKLYGTWWVESGTASTSFELASRTVLSNDNDFQSLSTFEAPKGKFEIARLYRDVKNALERNTAVHQRNLYFYARFRSRLRFSWWPKGPNIENIVQSAILSNPRPEISTLAWLCRGEIGSWEVKNLPASAQFWAVVIDSPGFNESQRLELFLLLLQFGAHIETRCTFSGNSILCQFILGCRIRTVSTVVKEICRRFNEVKDQRQVSTSTRYYITGKPELQQSEVNSVPTTLTADLYLSWYMDRNYDALKELVQWDFLHESQVQIIVQKISSRPRSLLDEHQPLLQLPLGWEKIKEFGLPFYRDSITGSITLQRPTGSLLLTRQIALGYNTSDNQESCYIDITGFISPENGRAAKEIFDQGINQRFQSFDESWFNMEQYGPSPSDDVLKALQDPRESIWSGDWFRNWVESWSLNGPIDWSRRNLFDNWSLNWARDFSRRNWSGNWSPSWPRGNLPTFADRLTPVRPSPFSEFIKLVASILSVILFYFVVYKLLSVPLPWALLAWPVGLGSCVGLMVVIAVIFPDGDSSRRQRRLRT